MLLPRKLCLLIAFTIAIGMQSTAQEIISAQYRINDGQPVPMNLNPDAVLDDGGVEYNIEVDSSEIPIGFHTIAVRFRSSEGLWSHWREYDYFQVNGEKFLSGAEWFINEDPGEGNGTPIELPDDGAWDERVEEFAPEISDYGILPSGINTIYVRAKDQDGRWGATRSAVFEIVDLHIAAAEWTLNASTEPGSGNPLHAVDGAFDSSIEELISDEIESSQLPEGFHPRLYARVQDNFGRWSSGGSFSQDDSILINRQPIITEFSPGETSIQFDLAGSESSISFSVLVNDPDGDTSIIGYLVNGELQSTGPDFSFMPSEPGTYTVTAEVTDDFDGSEVSQEWTVNVTQNGAPITPTPTVTPTPVVIPTNTPAIPTPTPEEEPTETEPSETFEFNQQSLADSGWSQIAGGFRGPPFGEITVASDMDEMTSEDGLGLSVTVGPSENGEAGEIAFIHLSQPIESEHPVLIRATLKATNGNASIALLALKGNILTGAVDGSIGIINPSTSSGYIEEGALALMYQPDQGTTFTPALQVSHNSGEETTITVDKIEIYILDDNFDQHEIFAR